MVFIKPHHFVDIITLFGEGRTPPQSHPLGHAVYSVTQEILANRDVELCMEFGADDICIPCRQNIDGVCADTIDISFRPQAPESKLAYNLLLDQRWSQRLGVQPCDRLTARDLCLRIRDRAGDISDIYWESPADGIAQRQAKLRSGVAKFLE